MLSGETELLRYGEEGECIQGKYHHIHPVLVLFLGSWLVTSVLICVLQVDERKQLVLRLETIPQMDLELRGSASCGEQFALSHGRNREHY